MNTASNIGLAAAAALIAAASPAFAAPPSGDPCFLTRDMRNHTVGDDHTMYVDVNGRSVYRATFSNNCLAGATSSDPMVLRDRGGMGRICHPLDFDVSVRGTQCIVSSLTRLTPAEAAALPRGQRP
jgi:hypothetical protein